MTFDSILFNEYGRARSGWRFIIFMLAFVFFGIVAGLLAHSTLSTLPIGYSRESLLFKAVDRFVPLIVVIMLGWACGKFLEGLPVRALGVSPTRNWFKDLLLGSLIGAATFSMAVLIAVITGGLNFSFNPNYGMAAILTTMFVSFCFFAIAAAFEEALCRGYILQTFARAGLIWPAIIGTSILFGAGHLGNPNASWISVANTVLAGIWFGVAYKKTRTLWLPFGMHFLWNWVQGSIFGIEVSGLTDMLKAPLLVESDSGPAWLTGASYGIEAGIACTIVLAISTIVINFLPVLRPTEDMFELTSRENPIETETRETHETPEPAKTPEAPKHF